MNTIDHEPIQRHSSIFPVPKKIDWFDVGHNRAGPNLGKWVELSTDCVTSTPPALTSSASMGTRARVSGPVPLVTASSWQNDFPFKSKGKGAHLDAKVAVAQRRGKMAPWYMETKTNTCVTLALLTLSHTQVMCQLKRGNRVGNPSQLASGTGLSASSSSARTSPA